MSSCNALSVMWAISPIKTVGWAAKTSCNAARAKVSESVLLSTYCTQESSCNGRAELRPDLRPYPGGWRARPVSARHSRARGSSPGSALWPASDAGFRHGLPCDRRGSSNTAGAADFSDRAGISIHNTGTYGVFRASSIHPPCGGSCDINVSLTGRCHPVGKKTRSRTKNNERSAKKSALDRKAGRRQSKKNHDVHTARVKRLSERR